MTNQQISNLLTEAATHLDDGYFLLRQRQISEAREEAGAAQEIYSTMHTILRMLVSSSRFAFVSKNETQNLEGMLRDFRRGIASSHLLQAEVNYEVGSTDYNAQTCLLDTYAKTALESAVKSCEQAAEAFAKFNSSFVTPHERGNRSMRMAELFPLWADACLKLAEDANYRATQVLADNPVSSDEPDRREILRGVHTLMAAFEWYGTILRVYRTAAKEDVQMQQGIRITAMQRKREINRTVKDLAGSIIVH